MHSVAHRQKYFYITYQTYFFSENSVRDFLISFLCSLVYAYTPMMIKK